MPGRRGDHYIRDCGAMALLALSLAALPAQLHPQPPSVHLSTVEAPLARATFSSIGAVREVSTSLLLVTDPIEETLRALDIVADSSFAVGRKGSGPREYAAVGALVRAGADTTFLPDMANRRWHVLVGLEMRAQLGDEHPYVRRAGSWVHGSAESGSILSRVRLGYGSHSPGVVAESLAIVRVFAEDARSDTLAIVRGRPVATPSGDTRMLRNPMAASAFGLPLTAPEQAIRLSDGWVAVLRLSPARMEWIAPSGARQGEIALGVPEVKVDDRERRAYLARMTTSSGRATRPPEVWPDVATPVTQDALREAPDGSVVVELALRAGDDLRRYLIVSRTGVQPQGIHVDTNERVVSFGARHAYITRTNDDGLLTLHRAPWPH